MTITTVTNERAKDKKKTEEKKLLLSFIFSPCSLSLSNVMLRRQAKENNQNNNSNEKRKRDGIAVGYKSRDELG
jgi:hypothetical protein